MPYSIKYKKKKKHVFDDIFIYKIVNKKKLLAIKAYKKR